MSSLENDVKEVEEENPFKEYSQNNAKGESSSEYGASSCDEEEDPETPAAQGENLAKSILEEIQGLRVDMQTEIQTACGQFMTVLNELKQAAVGHQSAEIPRETPAASAQQGKQLSPSISSASTQYSHVAVIPTKSIPEVNNCMDCSNETPPPEKKGFDLVQFGDEVATDSAITPSNSCTYIPNESVKDSSTKERIDAKPEAVLNIFVSEPASMLVDQVVSDSCDADSIVASDHVFTNSKKTSYNFAIPTRLNTKIESQEKQKSLEALSLRKISRTNQKDVRSQLVVTRTSIPTNELVNESIVTIEKQEKCRAEGLETTSASRSAHISYPYDQGKIRNIGCVTSQSVTHRNTTKTDAISAQDGKHTFHASSSCLPTRDAMENDIESNLKTKIWKYDLAESKTFIQPVECESTLTIESSISKTSPPLPELACRYNNFEAEKVVCQQKVEHFYTEKMYSSSCENVSRKVSFAAHEGQNRVKSETKFWQRSTPPLRKGCVEPKSELALPTQDKNIDKRKSESYRCDVCQRAFSYSWLLKDHLRLHLNKRRNKCQTCKKSFVSEADRNRHMLSVHFNVKCYECIQCGKFCSTKESLAYHKKSHTGLKPFTCQVCDESFSSNSKLQWHKSQEHKNTVAKPHQCGTCNKSFYSEAGLNRHSRIHTGEKPFPCRKCGKHFRSAENLSRHLLTHSDGIQHKCRLCKKAFGNSSSLKRHLLIYHEEKKYECEICRKSFAHYSYLKFHMKNHALEDIPQDRYYDLKKMKKSTPRRKPKKRQYHRKNARMSKRKRKK